MIARGRLSLNPALRLKQKDNGLVYFPMVSLRDRVGMFPPKQLETPYLVSRLGRYIYSCHYFRAAEQGREKYRPGTVLWRPKCHSPKRQLCKNTVKGKQPSYGKGLNQKTGP